MAQAVVEQKRCPKCGQCKQIDEFFRNRRRGNPNGRCTRCKLCMTEQAAAYKKTEAGKAAFARGNKKWRQSDKGKSYERRPEVVAYRLAAHIEHLRKHPDRATAREAVKKATHHGKMPRASTLPCAHCNKPACGYHHHKGYEPENHLDVIPLCKPCHQLAG